MLIDKRLVEAIHNGDSITDEELRAAIKFYRQLTESLNCLGDLHRLSANDARNTLYRLEGYYRARKEDTRSYLRRRA